MTIEGICQVKDPVRNKKNLKKVVDMETKTEKERERESERDYTVCTVNLQFKEVVFFTSRTQRNHSSPPLSMVRGHKEPTARYDNIPLVHVQFSSVRSGS